MKHLWPTRAAWPTWILLGLLALLGIFGRSLWSSNETREGAMIREMARENVWVTAVFNGQAYLEKPPLLHWTGVLLCRLAGRVNEGLVRLPAAIYGFGTLWLIGLWARALGRERAGLWAASLCATTALFFEYSRIVLTDTTLTFMVLAGLYLFWRAWERPSSLRWSAFIVVTALSFYAKGLLGPGLVWVAVAGFFIWQHQWRRLIGLGLLFSIAFIILLAPWAWALWRAGGQDYLRGVFWDNQFGRFLTFNDPDLPLDPYFVHKEPIWFYMRSLPFRLLPWTLLVLPAMVAWYRRQSRWSGSIYTFWRVALVGMLLVLHISSAKAACYALPLFPLLFLMTGFWLDDLCDNWTFNRLQILVTATFAVLAVLALLAPLGCLAAAALRLPDFMKAGPAAVWRGVAFCVLALIVYGIGVWRLRHLHRSGTRAEALLNVWQTSMAVLLLVGSGLIPIFDYHRTYLPLVERVRQSQLSGLRLALVDPRERDLGALMFYLDDRFPTVSVSNKVDCQTIMQSQPGTIGWIIQAQQLPAVSNFLPGMPMRLEENISSGYKSASFKFVLRADDGNPAGGGK